jgi:hypothetical protein
METNAHGVGTPVHFIVRGRFCLHVALKDVKVQKTQREKRSATAIGVHYGFLVGELLVSKSLGFVSRDPQSLAALLFVGLKISFAPMDVAIPFKGHDVGGDTVQEPSVVRDHHDASNEVQDGFLECSQRIHVEVVGRFVEQKDIASSAEQLGQMNPIALPT